MNDEISNDIIILKKFLASIEIHKFHIISSNFYLNENIMDIISNNITINFNASVVKTEIINNYFNVHHQSIIILTNDGNELFKLDLIYNLSFLIENLDDVNLILKNEKALDLFKKSQVMHFIYPFIRNYFHNCLSNVGLQSIDLPMIKFF